MSEEKSNALQVYFMNAWKIVRGELWAQATTAEEAHKAFDTSCEITRKTIIRLGADLEFAAELSDHAYHWLAVFRIKDAPEEMELALPWMHPKEIAISAVAMYIHDSMKIVVGKLEDKATPVLGVPSMDTVVCRPDNLASIFEACPRCSSDISVGSAVTRFHPEEGTRVFQEITVQVESSLLELEVEWPRSVYASG